MHSYTRALALLASLLIFVVACRDGESSSGRISAALGGTVTSSDALVELIVPPGALDQDTTITIEPSAELPEVLAGLRMAQTAYRLEPDGLQFNVPAHARITLDGMRPHADGVLPAVTFFIYDEANGAEPLGEHAGLGEGEQRIVLDAEAESVRVEGSIRHFSWLIGVEQGLAYELERLPSPKPLESEFFALLTVENDTFDFEYAIDLLEHDAVEPVLARGGDQTPGVSLPPTASHTFEPLSYGCDSVPGSGAYGAVLWTTVDIPADLDCKPLGPFACVYQDMLLTLGPNGVQAVMAFEAPMECGDAGTGWLSDRIRTLLQSFMDALLATAIIDLLELNGVNVDSGPVLDTLGELLAQPTNHVGVCSLFAGRAFSTGQALGVHSSVPHAISDPVSAAFECGDGPDAYTLCPDPADPLPEGDYVVAINALMEAVPLADPTYHYQYGFVFDADGDPANNYQPPPQFANDFFKDSDLWFVASYAPATGWELQITDARDNDPMPIDINARILIEDNALILVVPPDAFTVADPGYRVTAFKHDGRWADDPNREADLEPPVDGGLQAFDGAVQ